MNKQHIIFFTDKWEKAQYLIEENKLEQADELLDWCLLILAKATLRGEKYFKGESINLWKTRVWTAIENAGLLPE